MGKQYTIRHRKKQTSMMYQTYQFGNGFETF